MKVSAERLRRVREEINALERQYLEERGWKHSCNHPDSCWRWQKEFGGCTYTCDMSGALKLQARLSEDDANKVADKKCKTCEHADEGQMPEDPHATCMECYAAILAQC